MRPFNFNFLTLAIIVADTVVSFRKSFFKIGGPRCF